MNVWHFHMVAQSSIISCKDSKTEQTSAGRFRSIGLARTDTCLILVSNGTEHHQFENALPCCRPTQFAECVVWPFVAPLTPMPTCDLCVSVSITVHEGCAVSQPEEYWLGFDVICVTECSVELQRKIDRIVRPKGVFFGCNSFGFLAMCFVDLGDNFVWIDKSEVVPVPQS